MLCAWNENSSDVYKLQPRYVIEKNITRFLVFFCNVLSETFEMIIRYEHRIFSCETYKTLQSSILWLLNIFITTHLTKETETCEVVLRFNLDGMVRKNSEDRVLHPADYKLKKNMH